MAMVSSSGFAASSCRSPGGQTSFQAGAAAAALKSIGKDSERRTGRSTTTRTIRIRPPYGIRSSEESLLLLLLQQKNNLPLSHISLPRIFNSNSNSKIAAAASKDRSSIRELPTKHDEARINGKNQKQQPASSSSERRQVLVKDGFAGLSALKQQLERERPRVVSRVKQNGLVCRFFQEEEQTELRRREIFVICQMLPKFDGIRETGTTSEVRSSGSQVHEGNESLIRVTNLSSEVTEDEYRLVMRSAPGVASWKYLSESGGGQCLGHGFCEVEAHADVEGIIQHVSRHVLHGKKLKASLAKSSEHDKRTGERQVGQGVTLKVVGKETPSVASSSNSMKDKLSKGSPTVEKQPGLRDVWKVQDSTKMRSAEEDSSEDMKARQKSSELDVEAEQISTSRMPSSAREINSVEVDSSTRVDSSQGLDSDSATRLSGQSVLEALQRAAAPRESKEKPRRGKCRLVDGMSGSDSDSQDESILPTMFFKAEWDSRIEELENDLKLLRKLS